MTTYTAPLAMFDITIPCDRYETDRIKSFMRTFCKKWAFQKERGSDSGYLHYQCRVSFTSKKRPTTAIAFINEHLPGSHISPTANPTYLKGDDFYVLKEDTRVEGPWTDRNDLNTDLLPKRFRSEPEWYPWQRSVIERIGLEADDRSVDILIDTSGCNGKTHLAMYLKTHQKAQRIPPQKEAKDIMRCVMSQPIRSVYFIDLPRCENGKNQDAIFSAIEEIKNGYCYDDRYKFQDLVFDPPHVWVFCNCVPDIRRLSHDRWRLWTISNRELVPYH